MITVRRFSHLQALVWALLFAVSLTTAISPMNLATAQSPGTFQVSQSSVTTNFGVAPSVQIANTSFAAAVAVA